MGVGFESAVHCVHRDDLTPNNGPSCSVRLDIEKWGVARLEGHTLHSRSSAS